METHAFEAPHWPATSHAPQRSCNYHSAHLVQLYGLGRLALMQVGPERPLDSIHGILFSDVVDVLLCLVYACLDPLQHLADMCPRTSESSVNAADTRTAATGVSVASTTTPVQVVRCSEEIGVHGPGP